MLILKFKWNSVTAEWLNLPFGVCFRVRKNITEVLKLQLGQLVCQRLDFKIFLLIFKALNNVGTKYSTDLHLCYKSRPIRPSGYSLTDVQKVNIKMVEQLLVSTIHISGLNFQNGWGLLKLKAYIKSRKCISAPFRINAFLRLVIFLCSSFFFLSLFLWNVFFSLFIHPFERYGVNKSAYCLSKSMSES